MADNKGGQIAREIDIEAITTDHIFNPTTCLCKSDSYMPFYIIVMQRVLNIMRCLTFIFNCIYPMTKQLLDGGIMCL